MTLNNENKDMTIVDGAGAENEAKVGLTIVEEDAFENEDVLLENLDIEALQDIFGEGNFELNAIQELLDLDEEHFDALSEPFLIEFESNIKSNKEAFALLAKQNDYQLSDFEEAFEEISQDINASEELSQNKKDFLIRLVAILFNALFEDIRNEKLVSIPYELCKEVEIPKYANMGDAGMDLYSPEEYTIEPGETIIIPTGIKMAIPVGYAVLIQPRSGQSVKTKLRIANTPGLIDSGYRDEIGVIIENIEPKFKDIDYEFDDNGEIKIKSILHGNSYTITKGQRFAQMRLVEVPIAALFEVDSVGEIGENRNGGFGSSGA